MDNKLLEHIIEIKSDISAIKTDISHHIKRTDLLEASTKKFERSIYMFYGVAGFLGLLVSIVKVLEFFTK